MSSETPIPKPPADPHAALVDLIGWAQRRMDRARNKLRSAQREADDAAAQYAAAIENLDRWEEENPPAQMEMFRRETSA